MKQFLILVAFFLPLSVLSQDCKLSKETDPYTRETKLSSGFIYLDGASVTIDADSKEINFLFSVEGSDKCFDDNSTIEVYFEGIKAKTGSRNAGTMNCEGLVQLVYKNSNNTPTTLLQRFCTKKVTKIIIVGNSKKPITINIGPKEQEALMALANCIVNEGRKLIK